MLTLVFHVLSNTKTHSYVAVTLIHYVKKNCLIDIDRSIMFTRGLEGGEEDRFKQWLLLTKDARTEELINMHSFVFLRLPVWSM